MQPGERISTFRIVAPLGQGGMGAVYRAVDEAAKREVALKVLATPWPDAELRRRFEREGRALAAVDHPNVVRVFAAGVDRANRPWLALELAPGGSLEALRRERGGRLPWREAARLGAQVARGLSALHAAGLVHRDLKPANVLIGDDGAAKVTDLGLVRADAATGLTRGGLTRTGEVVGTVGFMAPEQVDGASGVDARADLYALGATLHALISGRPPFDDQGWALVEKVLHATPAPLRSLAPDTPSALEALVLRLLAKSPPARPASADEVARALDHLATSRGAGRRPGRGVVVALAAAVTAALLAVAWSARPAERPGVPATAGTESRPLSDPRPEAVAADPARPAEVVTGPRKLGEGAPSSACFLADGRVVLARPDRLELWSASTGGPLGTLAELAAPHALLCPDPDGGVVVAQGDAVWRVSATGEVTGPRRAPSRVTSVAAAAGDVVLVGTERQAWLDLLTDPAPFSRQLAGHEFAVHAVALSSDGRRAATGTGAGFHTRSLASAAFVWRLERGHVDGDATQVETLLRVTALALVPGRDELLVGTAIGDVLRVGLDGQDRGRLVAPDTNAGDPALLPHAHRGFVASIAVSADGRRAWTVSSKRVNEPLDRSELRAWDLETGAERADVVIRETALRTVALSPDGAWLVTTSDGAPAELWPAN